MNHSILAHDHSELDTALADTFTALDSGDAQLSFHNLDIFWARLAVHIRAENLQLFPTLLRAAQQPEHPSDAPTPDAAQAAIAALRHDHDYFMKELTALVKQLREWLRGSSQDATPVINSVRKQLESIKQRLENHNELEESKVYNWASALLDKPAQIKLAEDIQRDLENLPSRLRKA